MRRISILLSILFTCLTAANAWAGSHIVYVPPPNGTDDTTNIQAALDTCVAYDKNCTVQLAAGTYLTSAHYSYI
jgi:polygalacturonase